MRAMAAAFFTLFYCFGLVAGCSDGSDRPPPSPPPVITALSVEPPIATLDVDSSEHYQAIASYSDGEVKNVTDLVDWSLEFDSGVVEAVSDPGDPSGFEVLALMPGCSWTAPSSSMPGRSTQTVRHSW